MHLQIKAKMRTTRYHKSALTITGSDSYLPDLQTCTEISLYTTSLSAIANIVYQHAPLGTQYTVFYIFRARQRKHDEKKKTEW